MKAFLFALCFWVPALASAQQAPASRSVIWLGALDTETRDAVALELSTRGRALQWIESSAEAMDQARAVAAERGASALFWVEPGTMHLLLEGGERHLEARLMPTSDPLAFAVIAGDLMDAADEGQGLPFSVELQMPVQAETPPSEEQPSPATAANSDQVEPPTPDVLRPPSPSEPGASDAAQQTQVPPGWTPAPSRRGPVFIEAALATNGPVLGLELGLGVWCFGPLAIGIKARALPVLLGGFSGTATGAISWVERDPDWAFDGGLEGGALLYQGLKTVVFEDLTQNLSLFGVSWIAGGFGGFSARITEALRLGSRLELALFTDPIGENVMGMALVNFHATLAL